MTNFSVVLVGCQALAGPLRAAGGVVLSSGVSPPSAEPPSVGGQHPGYAVIVVNTDRSVVSWAQDQAAKGVVVVALVADGKPLSPPVRSLSLPVQVDELLEVIGAQPIGGVIGSAEVSPNLTVRPTRGRDGLGLFQPRDKEHRQPVATATLSQLVQDPPRRGPVPIDVAEMTPFQEPAPGDLSGEGERPQAAGTLSVYDDPADSSPPDEGPWGDPEASSAPLQPARMHTAPAQEAPVQGMPVREPQVQGPPVQAVQTQPLAHPAPARPSPALGFEVPGPARPASLRTGAVIICFAAKGGVGKSTLTLSLGELASSLGMRTLVVDANRGQGDLRKYLRVNQAYLPSIIDAATSGDPSRAITTPERLASARPSGLPVPSFSTVLAPTDAQFDPALVTPAVYKEVLEAVRGLADLVIVDTQIVEAADIGGMVDEFMIPELLGDAWGLGISDTSPGADNLLRRIYNFHAKGVHPDRLMVAVNRAEPSSRLNLEAMMRLVEPYATWMGAINTNSSITTAFEGGAIPSSPAMDDLLGRVIERVTGVKYVAASKPNDQGEQQAKKRLFGWKRK